MPCVHGIASLIYSVVERHKKGGLPMRTFSHVIADRQGLHARSCVVLASEASKWVCAVSVRDAQREADGKSMASLLALRGACGDELVVCCDGPDEAEAASTIEALMRMSL